MKWFKHQSDARNSLKLRKVRRKYGADGYAIYWFCLEAIAYDVDKDNLTFDLREDAETIAFELSIQEKRVEEIMIYMVNVGLFESSTGVITCLKLAESIDKSMTNSPKMRAWLNTKSVMTHTDTVKTCPELEVDKEVEVDKNKDTIEQRLDGVSPKRKFNQKQDPTPESTEIITYMNQLLNAKFKTTTGESIKLITERLKDHSMTELKQVIDYKVKQWRNDERNAQYLRPKTLFNADNFEGYLIASRTAKTGINGLDTQSIKYESGEL